jgi:RsiW-degrading membrane proteinase PrsW (M82 family)
VLFHLIGALALSALPAFILLIYFYRKDRARPEPIGLVGKSALYGFLAVLPAAGIELGLNALLPEIGGVEGRLLQAFVVAAAVEESVKLWFVKRYLWRRPEFDERVDGIVYSICVSLGFALVENFMYGFADARILLLRAFTSVPLHAVATGVMGYWLGRAKIEGGRDHRPGMAGASAKGLSWAILIHGSFDFFILTGGPATLLILPLLLIGWLVLAGLFRKALALDAHDPRLNASQNFPSSLL